MNNAASTDPRPLYRTAQDWVVGLIEAVEPSQLDDPTPCPDWDVRTLISHLVGTVDRARAIGQGIPPFTVPSIVVGLSDAGLADAFRESVDKLWPVWDDDDSLTRMVEVPWGTVPGAAALLGYVREALVHGWDLAVATGQSPEADPAVASAALAAATAFLPADAREFTPFGLPVPSSVEAGPTEQLANWLGHGWPAA
jgi:uncharacterized protein (TIGR03086 family)